MEEVKHKINRFNDKESKEEKDVLDKVDALLNEKKWVRVGEWNGAEVDIYLINLSSEDFLRKKNKWLVKIKEWITANVPGEIIPYSADHEK